MNGNLYRVKHQSWNNYQYVAATNQANAASIACQDTSDEPEKCSVEYIGKVVIEPNIKEREDIDL